VFTELSYLNLRFKTRMRSCVYTKEVDTRGQMHRATEMVTHIGLDAMRGVPRAAQPLVTPAGG
jgi:hypothetical protein